MPTVTINPATLGAVWILTGTVNPNSSVTTAYFEYGTTIALGSVTPTFTVGSGSLPLPASQELPTLQPNTTYYFRLTAINLSGTTSSSILTFVTGSNPSFFAPKIQVISSTNAIIQIQNDLQFGPGTTLSRDSMNNTVCFVENSFFLQTGQKYLLGTVGASNAEIVQVSSITSPTNATPSQVTFAGPPINKHARGEPLRMITYDQAEVSTSPTQDGVYTIVTTQQLQVNSALTIVQDSAAQNTNYYRARFYNGASLVFSNYSVPVSAAVTSQDSAGYLINALKKTLGISDSDQYITNDFLIGALNEARQIYEFEIAPGKMHEWRQVFEYPIKMLAGTNYVTLPTNIDYSDTNRSTLNARYSNNSVGSALPLTYIDKAHWNFATYQRRYTTIAQPVAISATTIVLNNTGDFPAAGAITLQAEDWTQVPITVSYTANNIQTNTLTGCTGVTRAVSVGSQAWAYQTQMYPQAYTIFNGIMYFDSMISLQMQGKNVFIDYYSVYQDVLTMQDLLPEHHRNIYKNYLRFAIKRRRDNAIGETDPDYVRFLAGAQAVAGNEYLGQMIRVI